MSLELLNNPLIGNLKDWDKPLENENFQDKFPEFPKTQESKNFPKVPVQYNFKQLTTKEIAERDFGGKPLISGKNYEVYTDEKEIIKEGEIEEVQLYSYLYQKTIDGIKVKLFASKNGVLLLQRYLDVIVQPDELVLFLEIKGDLDFNTVMHIKSGTDLTHRKDLPFKEIINFSNLHKVEISGAKIKNLIEKEIYKDKHSFMRWFFSITNALAGNLFSFFTKDIVKEGAEGFKTIANKIQEYRLDENRWNPEPKEGGYNPVFIPDEYVKRMEKAYLHQEYDNPNQNVKAQRNIISQISKNFFDELSHTKSFALDTLKETKQYLPTVLYNKLQSIVNYVFKQIDSIEKAISDPFAALGQLIYKKQKIVNAFLCGVYNSILDIIAGIFSLVAFIFEAVYTIEDVKDQTLIYAEMLIELFENLAEGILNFNFAEFFFNWITFEIKTLFRLINFIETLAKTSLEKYAYYYGYIVGIVIDIIVETLLTGGVAAVEKLLQSVEAFLRNPLQKIAKAIEKSAIFVENLLQKIINFLDFLAKKLKKGAGDLFKDLEKLLDEIFGFGEEVADHALTPSEKRYKDKLKAQQERIERRSILAKRTIDGKPAPTYEKGFEYYDARTPKLSEIPFNIRRQSRLLTHKVDKEIADLLDISKTSGLSRGKKILLDKKGRKFIQKAWLKDRQLVSGIIHQDKKLGEIIISKTNFPKSELERFIKIKRIGRGESNISEIKEIYKYFKQKKHIDFDMHPYIEELLEKHFYEASKGIKHPPSYNWERTGGLPGTHAEVLALNDLLWTLENKGIVLTDELLKGFIGYNKRILDNTYMIRCGDCQLILKDVLFLEKITKFK